MYKMLLSNDFIGWRVGNRYFKNKWEAIFEYTNNPTDFAFYYYDRTWDKFDWSVEPISDIGQLERQHCKNLRKNNNLLILAYSGGIDSHTVLTRFIESKQHLDYIICFSVGNDINHHSEFEVKAAIEKLKKLQPLIPNTKLLFTNENIDLISRVKLGNGIQAFDINNIQNTEFRLRFHHSGWAERLKVEHPAVYDELKNKNGKIIIGSHSPEIKLLEDDQFWFVPNDKQDENVQDIDSHEFFWSGQDPTLFIKQCHLAKRWLRSNRLSDSAKLRRTRENSFFLDFSLAIGREPPAHPIFAFKNCFDGHTNMEFLNQFCGIVKHDIYVKLCEVDQFKQNLNKLDQFAESFSKAYPHLMNYHNKDIDVYGWLGTPRCLGS